MAEQQYLYLTTTGWKSGQPHEIEIWYVACDGAYYIVSEMRERAHWVQNIQRNPAIQFRVGDQTFTGSGRVITDGKEPERVQAIKTLMEAKYGWSDGLIVELQADTKGDSS